MVQQPLTDLPGKVIMFLRTLVSVKRLERYLAEPELAHLASSGTEPSSDTRPDVALGFEEATLIYPQHEVREDSDPVFELRVPSFNFPTGKLSIVCGNNASGKSSILMALLGGKV
jgi:ABC-type siderophore export system fused ATPase/permease subunit